MPRLTYMINGLKALFAAILALMLYVTAAAARERGVIVASAEYCGFLTFYAWVFYRERGAAARIVWLMAILGLGSIATSAYVLVQLTLLPSAAGVERLLLRETR
jgi:hypothetical protein